MHSRTRNHQDLFIAAAAVLLVFCPMLPAPLTVGLAVGLTAALLTFGIAGILRARLVWRKTSG
ncbi:MAG TPA: hypothetical protein PKY77_18720 [Phycisphaerae bacterium]|nr:hypothetical protein [Phycisphaerae bacterium]HRY66387.1 hypothetical protein [Phycisphaerae bacterium]HSA25906.1 hypothetical protein [Phycisphaerae bacterium]